jgi:parvulin-like peptidyl-prolyl isomerase
MMRNIFAISLLLICLSCTSQPKSDVMMTFEQIASVDEAKEVIAANPDLGFQIVKMNTNESGIKENAEELSAGNTAIVKAGGRFYYYRMLSEEVETEFRVSYIFLDGNSYSKYSIDSIRTVILDMYDEGVEFAELAKGYSMDNNAGKGGDLGWFKEGIMVPEFEAATKAHDKDDVYTVDVPENKWYFVVKKTYNDKVKRNMMLLRVMKED